MTQALEPLELTPIAQAPVRAGCMFGPCVLDLGRQLRIGYWDGERWHDRHDEPVAPYATRRCRHSRRAHRAA